jgi:shikimate dehydrogenase
MTDRYAVIGNPIAHSKSPDIHAHFARQVGHIMFYAKLLGRLDSFHDTVDTFRRAGGRGMNVTAPFKTEAFDFANEHTPRALVAGSANTLRFDGDRICADNTDGVGLTRDIRDNLGVPMAGKRILLLGAGGAARGVVGALLDEQPAALIVANRTHEKAISLVETLTANGANSATGAAFEAVSVDSLLQQKQHQFDIVINATSASLVDGVHNVPSVPSNVFTKGTLAYDMMYGKGQTPFMALAANAGATTADGLGMLVEQAAEAFWFFRGVRPKTATVLANLRAGIAI